MTAADVERYDRRIPAHRTLFDDLRQWSYSAFRSSDNDQVAWRADVVIAAEQLRPTDVSSDVAVQVATRVADWTWEHLDRDWTVDDLKQAPVPEGSVVRSSIGQPTWHLPARPPRGSQGACGARMKVRADAPWEHKPLEDLDDEDHQARCGKCFPRARRQA
ncbi:MAG: hypothetical protein EOP01_00285 [Propionibacteriaceae bacterium]|nr:MAG: hypothetical protein EOP01_00285 [Propionibacteriaceae bacterium]